MHARLLERLGTHAEFVFKVDDDFSNFIQMFTVAIEIARNFTIQYGRYATGMITSCCYGQTWSKRTCLHGMMLSTCRLCSAYQPQCQTGAHNICPIFLAVAQQSAEHSARVALHRGVQRDAGRQPGGLPGHLLLDGGGSHCVDPPLG